MKQDMTTGNPIKVILHFSVTILFGNLFQQMYNMADSMIVGRILGVEALAAVGATGSLSFLVLGFAIGTCCGFGVPIAHFVGAKDERKLKKCICNAVYLSAVISIVLTVLTVAGTPMMLQMMGTPDYIYQYAYDYIVIIFAGLGASIFYNLLTGIARAMGDVVTPLVSLTIAAGLNVVLDFLLIQYTGLGTAGAAYATVISQMVSVISCFVYMYKKYPVLHVEKELRVVDLGMMKRLLGVGIPMALQFSITAVGAIILQAAVNSLGFLAVGAVTAAGRIQGFVTQPLEAMGLTMATYCGQNYGAGNILRVKRGIRQSLGVMAVLSLVLWVGVSWFGESLTGLFLKEANDELVALTKQCLYMNGMFFMALGLLLIVRNAVQGLGYAGLAIFAGVFETIGRVIAAMVSVRKGGYLAVCYSNPIAWVLADVLLIGIVIYVLRKVERKKASAERETGSCVGG